MPFASQSWKQFRKTPFLNAKVPFPTFIGGRSCCKCFHESECSQYMIFILIVVITVSSWWACIFNYLTFNVKTITTVHLKAMLTASLDVSITSIPRLQTYCFLSATMFWFCAWHWSCFLLLQTKIPLSCERD